MNALMNVYATAEDAAAAESVLASMQRFGPRPSGFSYNTAIAAHARARPLVYIHPVSGVLLPYVLQPGGAQVHAWDVCRSPL